MEIEDFPSSAYEIERMPTESLDSVLRTLAGKANGKVDGTTEHKRVLLHI